MKKVFLNFGGEPLVAAGDAEPTHLNLNPFGGNPLEQIKQILAQKTEEAYKKVVAVHGSPKDCDDARYHYRVCADDRTRILSSTNIDDKAYVQAYDRFLPEAQSRIDAMCKATNTGIVPPPGAGAPAPAVGGAGAADGSSAQGTPAGAGQVPTAQKPAYLKYVLLGVGLLVIGGTIIYLATRKPKTNA